MQDISLLRIRIYAGYIIDISSIEKTPAEFLKGIKLVIRLGSVNFNKKGLPDYEYATSASK